jgi:5'-methylthioadenosine phosphorylase
MKDSIGIIGGSGLYQLEGMEIKEEYTLKTPFGSPSDVIVEGEFHGKSLFFIPRHGKNHTLLPSEIPFAANVFALKSLGVKTLISIGAVGSLREEIAPGDMVVPSTFFDKTKNTRLHTFCGKGAVGHVSLAHPVCSRLQEAVKASCQDYTAHFDKSYVCIEGPQFSTRAESHVYRQLGFDIIGMTAFPEYALVREAGMSYLPLSFVTDYDCWNEKLQHVTMQAAVATLKENTHKAHTALANILQQLDEKQLKGCPEEGLKNGLLTPKECLTQEQLKTFSVLQA